MKKDLTRINPQTLHDVRIGKRTGEVVVWDPWIKVRVLTFTETHRQGVSYLYNLLSPEGRPYTTSFIQDDSGKAHFMSLDGVYVLEFWGHQIRSKLEAIYEKVKYLDYDYLHSTMTELLEAQDLPYEKLNLPAQMLIEVIHNQSDELLVESLFDLWAEHEDTL